MRMCGRTPVLRCYSVHQSERLPLDGMHKADVSHSRLRVVWTATDGTETVIADTTEGYRVLETSWVTVHGQRV
jgi:hypothetical protein